MLIKIKISIQLLTGSDKPRMLFFLLINVKMSTIVDILIFRVGKFSCSVQLSMNIFLTSGPGFAYIHRNIVFWALSTGIDILH